MNLDELISNLKTDGSFLLMRYTTDKTAAFYYPPNDAPRVRVPISIARQAISKKLIHLKNKTTDGDPIYVLAAPAIETSKTVAASFG